jgi:glyoxylase-like metal-dependent hydrolase (beta-lactamase superfamily II)
MLTLGPATVERIVDMDRFALPLAMLFPGARLAAIADARDWLAPDHVDFASGEVLLGVQSHLLRIGGLTILIDACVGEGKRRPNRAEWHMRAGTGFLGRLAAVGVRPEDVDIVMCTHLHADHVGWNTRMEGGRWVPTFPRARYMIGRTELSHWQGRPEANHGVFADSVQPLLDARQVEIVDDGIEVTAGLRILPLAGHTPGQIGLELDHGAGHALLCGDALHSPVQLHRPEWSSAFCSDPQAARATRRALLARSSDEGALLLPAHLRGPSPILRAVRDGTAWRPGDV